MNQESLKNPNAPAEFELLLHWWQELENHRGDRAMLRRASGIEQVMFNPAFHRLWRKLKGTRWTSAERVAVIAALAARVKVHDSSASFAAQLGTAPAGRDKPAFSGLRFRRLLQIADREELLSACSRAIALLGGRINLTNLAESTYWWNDGVRKQWAFDYYATAPSAD